MHFCVGTSVQIFCNKRPSDTQVWEPHSLPWEYIFHVCQCLQSCTPRQRWSCSPACRLSAGLCCSSCQRSECTGSPSWWWRRSCKLSCTWCRQPSPLFVKKQFRSDVTSHLCAVLGITGNLLHHADMDILGVTEAAPLYILTNHVTYTP